MTRWLLLAAIFAGCFACAGRDAAAMGFPGKQDEIRGIHAGERFPLIQVTHIVASEDGRYVAAAYHQHAQNRPGTNWNAWVALWDRVTGRRMIYPNAFGPVAISADGGLLAMPFYDRVPGERSHYPAGRLSLVRVGERKPERVLRWDDPAENHAAPPDRLLRNPVGLCFAPEKTHLIELTGSGALIAHDMAKTEDGKLLARLAPKALPPGRWLAAEAVVLGVNPAATEVRLATAREGLTGGFVGRWSVDLAAGKAEAIEAKQAPLPAPRLPGAPKQEPKRSITTGNGKLVITPDERGMLTIAETDDGKVLETLRLDEAPGEEGGRDDKSR